MKESETAPGILYLTEVDTRVEAGLGLLVERVFHSARLELLLRPKRFLLVEHLTELR